jgi:transcriptional regulator NrdR family protein
MICPTCNAWTRTLETRDKFDGTIHRRYECANLHRFNTTESVTFTVPKLPDQIREIMRHSFPQGATASEIAASTLDVYPHEVHNAIRRMRDAYIKEWVGGATVWAIAESERDRPTNAPRPKGTP